MQYTAPSIVNNHLSLMPFLHVSTCIRWCIKFETCSRGVRNKRLFITDCAFCCVKHYIVNLCHEICVTLNFQKMLYGLLRYRMCLIGFYYIIIKYCCLLVFEFNCFSPNIPYVGWMWSFTVWLSLDISDGLCKVGERTIGLRKWRSTLLI
jgi:hypothetical protein